MATPTNQSVGHSQEVYWNTSQTVTLVSGSTGPVASDAYAKVQSTNSTDTAFDAHIPTTTEPAASATRGVLTTVGRESMLLAFFGTGNDNDTFDYKVIGWQKIATLWIATTIVQGSATLSACVGVSGATIADTERFADTLDIDAGVGVVTNAPVADACPASLEIGVGPFDYVEVLFDRTGASAANAVYTTF